MSERNYTDEKINKGHGCKHCVEYGRLLDNAKRTRIEDGKSYRDDIESLQADNTRLKEEVESAHKLTAISAVENKRLREALKKVGGASCTAHYCGVIAEQALKVEE